MGLRQLVTSSRRFAAEAGLASGWHGLEFGFLANLSGGDDDRIFCRIGFPIYDEFDTIGDSQGNLVLAQIGYFITSTFCFIMSNSKIRGTVHVIEETKSFGQKGFRKRLVVLEQQNGRFANYIPVEFTNDACDAVDGMKLGDEVDVTYRAEVAERPQQRSQIFFER